MPGRDSLSHYDKTEFSPGHVPTWHGIVSLEMDEPEAALKYFEEEAMVGRKLMRQ